MAEEKKKIMIHTASGDHVVDVSDRKPKPKFGVLPVSDYVAAVADPDAQPQAGSVGAGGCDGLAGRAGAALGR